MNRDEIQFDFLCNKKKPGAYDAEILDMGGRIFRAPGLNPLKYPMYVDFCRQLFAVHPEYRILHVHNGALGVYALHAAKVNRIPHRIFHARGSRFEMDMKWPLKMFCLSRLPANSTLNWACGISAAKTYFGDTAVNTGNCRIIPNAIDVDRFVFSESTRHSIRLKHNLSDNLVVGHVGSFTKIKNHRFLLRVFRELLQIAPHAVLTLLGDGVLKPSIEQLAKELRVDRSVLFMGNVGNVNEWYHAFDVFVLPSFCEGFPVVSVEAQAAGLPCFFNDALPREIAITDHVHFLSINKNPREWAESVLLAASSRKRDDMHKIINSAGFNIHTEAKKLQSIYEEMVRLP